MANPLFNKKIIITSNSKVYEYQCFFSLAHIDIFRVSENHNNVIEMWRINLESKLRATSLRSFFFIFFLFYQFWTFVLLYSKLIINDLFYAWSKLIVIISNLLHVNLLSTIRTCFNSGIFVHEFIIPDKYFCCFYSRIFVHEFIFHGKNLCYFIARFLYISLLSMIQTCVVFISVCLYMSSFYPR